MMREKPNIIFVHVDQLKAAALGVNGCDRVKTPNIDRIMNEGVSFERSYASVPVCVPARTSWYTGLEPEQSGISENPRKINLNEVKPTDLGSWLRDCGGYESFYMGKWHIAIPEDRCGFQQLHRSNTVGEYGDAALARAAENFLLTHHSDKPFFLNVGLLNPHDICYWGFRYSPGKFKMAPGMKDQLPPLPPNFEGRGGWSDEEWRFYTYSYFRLVEMVDEEIGRIYRAYQRSPQRDNTVFIFSSDHGQGNGEHGITTKGSPYEHSLRVPLAFVDPKASPRRDADHLVSGLDMAPTICDYAGVEAMPRNHGISLKRLIRERESLGRDWLGASSSRLRHRIIMKGDFKLIYSRQDQTTELFNLKEDPWELNDLSGDPRCKKKFEELVSLREKYDSSREICSMAQKDLDRFASR